MTYFTGSVCSIIKLIAHDDVILFTLLKKSFEVGSLPRQAQDSNRKPDNERGCAYCFIGDRAHLIGAIQKKEITLTMFVYFDIFNTKHSLVDLVQTRQGQKVSQADGDNCTLVGSIAGRCVSTLLRKDTRSTSTPW